jgi:starvation-inducible DNA-binding protein
MIPAIGITPDNLLKVAQVLNGILADEFLLYLKTRNAHWNVEGADFYDKHKFFEEQYAQLDDVIDNVAERIRILGHYASATLKDYLNLTYLTSNREIKMTDKALLRSYWAIMKVLVFALGKI